MKATSDGMALLQLAALVAIAGASVPIAAQPDVAGAIRAASEVARATSFQTFLLRYQEPCSPEATFFNGALSAADVSAAMPNQSRRAVSLAGDLWSVRCSSGKELAIFIAHEPQARSWFLPCERLLSHSPFRCFVALGAQARQSVAEGVPAPR